MTGFGRAEAEGPDVRLQCEIRSVNHRYLSLKQRLPGYLLRYETWVEGAVRKSLARGSVEVQVQCRMQSGASVSELDEAAADRYLKSLGRFLSRRGLAPSVPPEVLLNLPGVLTPADVSRTARVVKPLLEQAVEQALAALVTMRRREGGRLQKVLLREVKSLRRLPTRIRQRLPGLLRAYEGRLRQRVDSLLADHGTRLDDATLAREVALVAERWDVTEEVDRLGIHLDQFEVTLAKDGGVGRELDFLAQEISREVHTIGSKLQDPALMKHVFAARGTVEKMREQVQNLE